MSLFAVNNINLRLGLARTIVRAAVKENDQSDLGGKIFINIRIARLWVTGYVLNYQCLKC